MTNIQQLTENSSRDRIAARDLRIADLRESIEEAIGALSAQENQSLVAARLSACLRADEQAPN